MATPLMRGVKSFELKAIRITLLLLGIAFFCPSKSGDLRFNHAIIAVNNLDAASKTFRNLGFRIKAGKKHKNGLVNSFIKLADNTEIELMALEGAPKNSIAKKYAEFLNIEEGGIYVALGGLEIQNASTLLQASNIEHQIKPGKYWDYIVFPDGSGIDHIFLIKMHVDNRVVPEIRSHGNKVSGLNQIWVESSDKLVNLLHTLGARKCDASNSFEISNILLTLTNQPEHSAKPKFSGLGFSGGDNSFTEPKRVHGVWLRSSTEYNCGQNS